MRYYDVQRHWTGRIAPHLGDRELNEILVRDFNKYTYGRCRTRFKPGQYPRDFETCLWDYDHRGRQPRFWQYVRHAACHWLVNFNLRLAQLVAPRRTWRIVTSQRHSTVWDGCHTLFDFNFLAFGIPPAEAFALADEKRLAPGEYLKVYMASNDDFVS
jgi:hypothetical protein